jgi:hypothetical protein
MKENTMPTKPAPWLYVPKLERVVPDGENGITYHQHIDNGGHTFSVDDYGNMVIQTGFYGYSNTKVFLQGVDLDGLIELLTLAKQQLRKD